MWQAIAAFLSKVLSALVLVVLGEERQKREQAERNNAKLNEFADIDRKPDQPSPFGRMRGK